MSPSTLIMGKPITKLTSDLRKQTYAFLEKLTEDDSSPGLHIEPIKNSRDSRVRTGRVSLQYRAVLFRLDGPTHPAYVFVGVWNHDDAIVRAQKSELTVNPVNGVSEIHFLDVDPQPAVDVKKPLVEAAPARSSAPTILGYTTAELRDFGLDGDLAARAARATSDDEILDLAEHAVEWQGLALLDLSAGTPPEVVREKLGLDRPVDAPGGEVTDTTILRGFEHPAAKLTYTFIEDNDELRRAIEQEDFGAWRVFLHPEQRRYATQATSGSFRLTGGAGTGKTVVLLHRADDLAHRRGGRILLTTFTTNLAGELSRGLRQLAPDVTQTPALHQEGVFVSGIDALASAVIKSAGGRILGARKTVLGAEDGGLGRRTNTVEAWQSAVAAAGTDLPLPLQSVAFLDAEYAEVILPHRLIDLAGYLKVRRPGRGVRLNRGERTAVWRVIESYRLSSRAAGSIDFREAAAIAAAYLDSEAETGHRRLFDHVLVDEGQDLSPPHWLLIRSLAAVGPDDVFIAEDSHQRIYGRRITLKQFGIAVVGRSRRLTLNYRTTAEILDFAMRVLEPGAYRDLDDEIEKSSDYRSARGGPAVGLRPCASLTEELATAAEQVRTWTTEAGLSDQPLESIAILVRDQYNRDRVVTGLAERGVTVRSIDREGTVGGAPVVMTMHRAKGMEFRDVLLFGIGADSIPRGFSEYEYSESEVSDALLRERSLLYVAATRARDQLVITWAKQSSPLLPASA
ncbi:3'-5' exonuclease [Microlunatus spumicola]|uniref:DNA 3'-5' helicase n=1 Tax=Microlunatus spumicola TaxID=81499 RepID=A0ABP6XRL7_9ACTN